MRRSIEAIAIDGPSGAGKTSLAKALAQKLGLRYMDTGAMYRAYGAAALERGLDTHSPEAAEELLRACKISLDYDQGEQITRINGQDMRPFLRTPEVARAASDLSSLPLIRMALVSFQQALASEHAYVLEGRDIGTVVLPDATIKIFLTASQDCRVERRLRQYEAQGQSKPREAIEEEIAYRDKQDSERAMSPLRPAPDAIIVDTSDLNFDESLDLIMEMIDARGD